MAQFPPYKRSNYGTGTSQQRHHETEGVALNDIAKIYETQGQYDKAIDYYQQMLNIAQTANNPAIKFLALNKIGTVYI